MQALTEKQEQADVKKDPEGISVEKPDFLEWDRIVGRLRENQLNHEKLNTDVELIRLRIQEREEVLKKEREKWVSNYQNFASKMKEKYKMNISEYDVDEDTLIARPIKKDGAN